MEKKYIRKKNFKTFFVLIILLLVVSSLKNTQNKIKKFPFVVSLNIQDASKKLDKFLKYVSEKSHKIYVILEGIHKLS